MSKLQTLRRTIGTLACGLLAGVLPVQFALAEAPNGQAASRAAAVKGAIEDIEHIVRTAPDTPERPSRIREQSWNAIVTITSSGNAALPSIETALADPAKDVKVKAMLCEALGQMKSESADELLGKVLDDPAQQAIVAAAAGDAIKYRRSPKAIDAIKRSVTNMRLPVGVRSHLMMYVAAVGGIEDVDWLARIAEGEGIGLPADPKAEIAQDEFTMILNAQRALGRASDPRAVEVLISLVDRYPANTILIKMLGNKKDPRAIPVLLRSLTTTSVGMGAPHYAARALAAVKALEAVDPLIEFVRGSRDPSMVAAAAAALGKIGDKRALPALEQVVANLKNDMRFPEAEWQLLERGHGYIAPIIKALEELR